MIGARWRPLAITVMAWTAGVHSLTAGEPAQPPAASSRPVDFERDVRPIFSEHCVACHGPDKQRSSFRLDLKANALAGGDFGPAIIPGEGVQSPLVRYAAHLEPGLEMPPDDDPLTPEQIGVLRRWIDDGAAWPDDGSSVANDHADWWAYQPLVRPAVPVVEDLSATTWVRTPIDAFILRRLREHDLRYSPAADRRTLLRRLSFDLHGLPPSTEEAERFLNDESVDAVDRLVERLLADPSYGERWARHWMDVVHFAETHGHDQDRPRENAWPYRDFLVQAFNSDLPYQDFVKKQIAGDVIAADDPEAIAATGFLAAGPWDESSLRDIRDDTPDREIARYLDRDDIISNVAGTFVATTVHCARCHDHKFDPVSQEDYYAWQAVFASTGKGDRLYDRDPATTERRELLIAQLAELDELSTQQNASWLTADVAARVAAWEKRVASANREWVVLRPDDASSTGGGELLIQPDGSVLATGLRADTDTYTITCRTPAHGLTGVRLDVLTDPSLPHQGPGRQDNGNLHLNEFSVTVASVEDPATARPLRLVNPRADFDQAGWTIAMAVDDNPATAWGIHPEVGRPHAAVFDFAEPVIAEGEVLLTFRLEQSHGRGHLIGRPRLSVTTAPVPLSPDAEILPVEIARIARTPVEERSVDDRLTLGVFVERQRLTHELAALPAQARIYCGSNQYEPDKSFQPTPEPRRVFLLRRGEISRPGAEALPHSLNCLPMLPADLQLDATSSDEQRRAALAGWIADERNPLTWRSIANRVWHYHFGRGLVATPNDFGRMGAAPSHPELLDWLACELQAADGSLKHLHRLICTSAVYRQSSLLEEPASDPRLDTDAGNQWLWRMNRRRLDAESIHDAAAALAGRLDRTMGGPSARQFQMSPGIQVTPLVDYAGFDVDAAENYRRSVYRFLFRTMPDPLMETLDCPDASQFAPVRNVSVTSLQALAMLNDRFLVRQAELIARRIERHAAADVAAQVRRLHQLVLLRPPTEFEQTAFADYVNEYGLPAACRVLLNSNEFMFID